jgi:hypothetical protein
MSKLTDTQLVLLSKAAQREDGAAVLPEKLSKAASAKVAASLIARKLMREIRAKPGMPVWRRDEDNRPLSLVILKAGRDAVGVEDETSEPTLDTDVIETPSKPKGLKSDATAAPKAEASEVAHLIPAATRVGTKQAIVIAMLSGEQGATLNALTGATGWLPHTMRAALTGLRKRGYTVERASEKGQPSIYRIVGRPDGSSADELMAA